MSAEVERCARAQRTGHESPCRIIKDLRLPNGKRQTSDVVIVLRVDGYRQRHGLRCLYSTAIN